MKLVSFKVEKMHDYLDIDVSFDERLVFLIGTNGSGKTSVLRLISAMTNGDISELLRLKFKMAELTIMDDQNVPATISYEKENTTINVTLCDKEGIMKDTFTLPTIKLTNFTLEEFNKERKRANALLKQEFREMMVVKKIISLRKVIFLDISRYVKRPIDDKRIRYGLDVEEDTKDINIDKVLENIQNQLYDLVRHNALLQERYADRLKTEVILECFRYVKTSQESSHLRMFSEKFENVLNEEREKVNKGIEVLNNQEVVEASKKFFDEIIKARQSLEKEKNDESKGVDLFSEVWMNSMTLDKIDKIIEHCNNYQRKINELKLPFTRLCESVNKFFSETHKKVDIDGRGMLTVKIIDKIKNNSITKLSSGEKQLIAIFADMTLNVNNRTSVVLIDEPDLSLHIAWQENLVEALQIANPDIQYVLATHSPSIISKLEWRNNTINLTKREQHGE